MIKGRKRKEVEHRHALSLLVKDKPGVLNRIAGMFSRRGFNIDTITVGKTTKEGKSKIVISLIADDKILEQVKKQLHKLVDVLKVNELPPESSVIREMCLIKIHFPDKEAKDEILRYTKIFKTKIVDINPENVTVEVVGEPQKIENFIELVEPFGIKEMSRTGLTAISRGK